MFICLWIRCFLMIAQILQTVKDISENHGIKHLALCGSASRNEFSFFIHDKKKIACSDIEFISVPGKNTIKSKYLEDIKKYENSLDLGELFSIDIGFISELQVSRLNNRLLTFEMKKSSKDIIGSLNKKIPDYQIKKIDKIELNQSILWRLISILHACKKNFKDKDLQITYFNYFISRNLLDAVTVYLFHKEIPLCTYADRAKYITEQKKGSFFYNEKNLILKATQFKLKPYKTNEPIFDPIDALKLLIKVHDSISNEKSKNIYEYKLHKRLYKNLIAYFIFKKINFINMLRNIISDGSNDTSQLIDNCKETIKTRPSDIYFDKTLILNLSTRYPYLKKYL